MKVMHFIHSHSQKEKRSKKERLRPMRFLALNLKKRRQVAETTTTLRRDVSCSSYDWKMLWERLSSECGSREARNSGTGSASAREMKRCWRYARYIEAKTDAGKIIGADGLNPIHVRRRRDGERNFGQSDARDRVRTKSPALIFPLFPFLGKIPEMEVMHPVLCSRRGSVRRHLREKF